MNRRPLIRCKRAVPSMWHRKHMGLRMRQGLVYVDTLNYSTKYPQTPLYMVGSRWERFVNNCLGV